MAPFVKLWPPFFNAVEAMLRRVVKGNGLYPINNVVEINVLQDELGFFGPPTSDSHRAMIQSGRRNVMTVLYAFDGRGDLEERIVQYRQLLMKFCGVQAEESQILEW